jgi:hypothetical protein
MTCKFVSSDQGLLVGLARLYPPAGDRPEAGAGIVPALDHQQAALRIEDDGAHARDHGPGHADQYPSYPASRTSVVRFTTRRRKTLA